MIRRRTGHWIFAAIGVTLTCGLGWQSFLMYQETRLNAAVQAVPDSLDSDRVTDLPSANRENPAVRIRIATALAKGNQLEAAETILNDLIRTGDSAAARQGAQFNLANAYLRRALSYGQQTTSQSLPLVELSKQRYRDLLQVNPMHWGARYNLERALRMAPEGSDRVGDEAIDPVKSVNVIVPGFEKKDLP